jgi:hypothetical protein
MIRRFHYYHKETGILHSRTIAINIPDDLVLDCVVKNQPPDHCYIEGEFHPKQHRIDPKTRKAVLIGEST